METEITFYSRIGKIRLLRKKWNFWKLKIGGKIEIATEFWGIVSENIMNSEKFKIIYNILKYGSVKSVYALVMLSDDNEYDINQISLRRFILDWIILFGRDDVVKILPDGIFGSGKKYSWCVYSMKYGRKNILWCAEMKYNSIETGYIGMIDGGEYIVSDFGPDWNGIIPVDCEDVDGKYFIPYGVDTFFNRNGILD
jgi:hypothetical protein